jgi:hypothetical protein
VIVVYYEIQYGFVVQKNRSYAVVKILFQLRHSYLWCVINAIVVRFHRHLAQFRLKSWKQGTRLGSITSVLLHGLRSRIIGIIGITYKTNFKNCRGWPWKPSSATYWKWNLFLTKYIEIKYMCAETHWKWFPRIQNATGCPWHTVSFLGSFTSVIFGIFYKRHRRTGWEPMKRQPLQTKVGGLHYNGDILRRCKVQLGTSKVQLGATGTLGGLGRNLKYYRGTTQWQRVHCFATDGVVPRIVPPLGG